MWVNQFAMMRDNHPPGTSFTRTSAKFMKAELGPSNHTVYLQRGFRQFGQPLETTLEAIVEVNEDEECEHYLNHTERLCCCDCEHCAAIAPHSVHNCTFKCKQRLTMDDKTMKELGLYTACHCQCAECMSMPGHMKSDCFTFCRTSPFNK